MNGTITENRKPCNNNLPLCVIYGIGSVVQPKVVLTTRELLTRLEQKGVKNGEVAKALGLSASRVTEMYKGERAIKLDEAAKLVSVFELEEPQSSPRVQALPAPIARLIVLYIASELGGAESNSHQLEALAGDVQAFAEFVTDPKVRESIDAAELFFQAMRLRRQGSQEEAPLGTDPQTTN